MQSRNKETLHRHTQSPRLFPQRLVHAAPQFTANVQIPDSPGVSFSGTVLTRTIMTLWLRFDRGRVGVRVNGPDCSNSTQVVSRDLQSQIWPCPAPVWGEMMLSGLKRAYCSCQVCLQLHRIKHSSNAIFTVCDVGQSAFHRLSNDV